MIPILITITTSTQKWVDDGEYNTDIDDDIADNADIDCDSAHITDMDGDTDDNIDDDIDADALSLSRPCVFLSP